MKNSNNHYATVCSLFNRLTLIKGGRGSPSPDVCTYAIFIDYCTQINQLKHGMIFFGRFIKVGQRANDFIFNPLLKGLCSENKIGDAVAMVLQKMSKFDCPPNVISYNTAIDGLCKKDAVNRAFNLLEHMLSEGLVPNVVTYSSLIYGLCITGEIRRAEEVLQQMSSRGHPPNVVTYSILINGLCKNGETEKAEKLLCYMVSRGLKPNVVTYNSLVDGFCKKRLLDKGSGDASLHGFQRS
ncbi:Pentatricopeptide repeat (PPR) superfamily protein [Rhynchospora pubera]|uniref:Pentatricopeptide repeat (PPR) superfamily protein n=1 Tax=Rhynchospora pubera TaxID=906938 RepID=A0AAV8EM95_9POAL|nr:Pentatricopeptide repeat (PPR) superfamily protein [Rhynchospora pubera]